MNQIVVCIQNVNGMRMRWHVKMQHGDHDDHDHGDEEHCEDFTTESDCGDDHCEWHADEMACEDADGMITMIVMHGDVHGR